jgi:hypothetical protein
MLFDLINFFYKKTYQLGRFYAFLLVTTHQF